MTMNLITGKAGAPHITSSDQGAMQAGLVGNGNYLLQGSDGKFPAVTMQSANKALIPVLNLVIEGRYARVTAAETVTIESGVTGRNRNDLICVKYTRDSNNIETIALAVLKGTATSGTAADPTVPSGSILNNSGTVWIPIARIPISGITAGTPVMLVKQLPPMSQLWDSVTQPWKPPIHEQQTHSMSRRTHRHDQRQRQVRRQWTAELYSTANETIPEAFRPLADQSIISRPAVSACLSCVMGRCRCLAPEIRLLHGARLLDGTAIAFRNPHQIVTVPRW